MGEKIDKNKLTIPIYLNTKIVFDMLATIEDGFSEVKNIQTSRNKNREEDAEANIGTGNHFALFNVGIKGKLKSGNNSGETITEEKTHTTVSVILLRPSAVGITFQFITCLFHIVCISL